MTVQEEDDVMRTTHRAVVEKSAPPEVMVVALGTADFCRQALDRWLDEHPLEPYEEELVLEIVHQVKTHQVTRPT